MSRILLLASAALLLLSAAAACRTASTPGPEDTAGALEAPPARLPAWLPAGLTRAPALEEAAALLCARDTDAVIDDDARHAAHVVDGQVVGMMRKASSSGAEAEALLASDAPPLLVSKRATHAGVAVGQTPGGEWCAAVVAARRLVALVPQDPGRPWLPDALPEHTPLRFDVRSGGAGGTASLYVMKPSGFVDKKDLDTEGSAAAPLWQLSVPAREDGRYIVELVVDHGAREAPDPEVAFLWPYVVGKAKAPPSPEVLFPDEGHDDIALTHRAEALVQRLRNEELLEPFKVSSALVDVAIERAKAVAARGALGHRIADKDVAQDVAARAAGNWKRLAEVQAQASTLAEAWQALLDSPAHRYVLVDTGFTHCGVAVARGKDAAGRTTVTMLAVLARKPIVRAPDDVRAAFLETANETRDKRGLAALVESARLNRVATRLAGAMRDNKKVDDTLLGGPVAQVALEDDGSLVKVKPYVARINDPLTLLSEMPALLLDQDASHAGVGVAVDEAAGDFYLVILAGE